MDHAKGSLWLHEERMLKEKCDIPISHGDQHGTAVITLAVLTNALKVVGKKKEDAKIITSGTGAAAVSIVKLPSVVFSGANTHDVKLLVRYEKKAANYLLSFSLPALSLSGVNSYAFIANCGVLSQFNCLLYL